MILNTRSTIISLSIPGFVDLYLIESLAIETSFIISFSILGHHGCFKENMYDDDGLYES